MYAWELRINGFAMGTELSYAVAVVVFVVGDTHVISLKFFFSLFLFSVF